MRPSLEVAPYVKCPHCFSLDALPLRILTYLQIVCQGRQQSLLWCFDARLVSCFIVSPRRRGALPGVHWTWAERLRRAQAAKKAEAQGHYDWHTVPRLGGSVGRAGIQIAHPEIRCYVEQKKVGCSVRVVFWPSHVGLNHEVPLQPSSGKFQERTAYIVFSNHGNCRRKKFYIAPCLDEPS